MANPANTTAYTLPDGRWAVDVTENKTLAVTDCGYVQNVTAAGVIFSVPATATLGQWTIRDGGVKTTGGPAGAIVSAAAPKVDPNGSDTLQGLNVSGTSADGKYAQVASASPGEELSILNIGATDGPIITRAIGNWAREA